MIFFDRKIEKQFVLADDFQKATTLLSTLAVGCKKHPAYRYHRKPRIVCEDCEKLYKLMQETQFIEYHTFKV